ncbi:MAG: penicillin-binding protein 2 [Leptospiraceae bacterium]|nr:penicillin-binding protein 2 [Leptospiraceae bacterium]
MTRSLLEFRLERRFQQRTYFFISAIVLSGVIMVLQLGNLQLLQGMENRKRAQQFVSRKEFIIAPRGLIYDRNFKPSDEPLVQNIKFIDFVIYPALFDSYENGLAFIQRFGRVMGRPLSQYREYLSKKKWKQVARRNESITLIRRMTHREQERLSAFQFQESYGAFVPSHTRYYTMGPALAHVTGYTGFPSSADLRKGRAEAYQTLGKAGIEAYYDDELRGHDGIIMRHRIIHSEERVSDSRQGNNLILSIDRQLQAIAYRSLIHSGRRGTAIAMNAGTGEILALVSHPSYDPNILSSGDADRRMQHLDQIRQHKAFLNRAIQIKTPPASTFKAIVALAALEDAPLRDITPQTSYSCYGSYTLKATRPGVPNAIYNCWNAGHGTNDLEGAIAQSCNVYFYQLGYHIGSRPIIRYARNFGLDKATGLDLPGEIKGLVPDARWKKINLGNRWYDGDTLNLAIGQGYLQTTPIEMLVAYGAIANGGKLMRPFLLKEIRDPDHHLIRRIMPGSVKEVPITPQSLATVRAGLRAVVARGTSRGLSIYKVPIAGKTGTAQTRSSRTASSHAWFVGYAPYDAPPEDTIVVVVFVEHGQGGSAAAAPIAGQILNEAFKDYKAPRPRPIFETLPSVNTGNQAADPGFVDQPTHSDSHTPDQSEGNGGL